MEEIKQALKKIRISEACGEDDQIESVYENAQHLEIHTKLKNKIISVYRKVKVRVHRKSPPNQQTNAVYS